MEVSCIGLLEKEDLTATLRVHQAAVNAIKSPQREEAEDLRKEKPKKPRGNKARNPKPNLEASSRHWFVSSVRNSPSQERTILLTPRDETDIRYYLINNTSTASGIRSICGGTAPGTASSLSRPALNSKHKAKTNTLPSYFSLYSVR